MLVAWFPPYRLLCLNLPHMHFGGVHGRQLPQRCDDAHCGDLHMVGASESLVSSPVTDAYVLGALVEGEEHTVACGSRTYRGYARKDHTSLLSVSPAKILRDPA